MLDSLLKSIQKNILNNFNAMYYSNNERVLVRLPNEIALVQTTQTKI